MSKEPTKVPQPELEELVKVMISCEQQADELYGHFNFWQDNLSTVRSMTLVDPLEEEIQESQIPYQLVVLGEDIASERSDNDPPRVASAEVVEENLDVPLQARTIPLDEVKANIEKWRPSIEAEHESLVRKTEAVELLTEEAFQELCKNHVVELIPGKSVHTIKAYTGRLKTTGVGFAVTTGMAKSQPSSTPFLEVLTHTV